LWKVTDSAKKNEKEIAGMFRVWFDQIKADPSMKPFATMTILLIEKSDTKYVSYKRLILAGGGAVVTKENIQLATLLICDKNEVEKHFPGPSKLKIPHYEPAFLNNVLLKKQKLG